MAELPGEEEFSKQVVQKYKQDFAYARELNALAQDVLQTGAVDTPDAYKTAIALIMAKAVKSHFSVIKLCEFAHTEDAGVVVRCLLNLYFIATWLGKDNSIGRGKRYLAWYWIAMHRLMCSSETDVPNEWKEEIERQFQAHKETFLSKGEIVWKWHQPEVNSIKQMSTDAGLQKEYDEIYAYLSSLEHSDSLSYFGMLRAVGGKYDLNVHDDRMIPFYLFHSFRYFGELFKIWNGEFRVVNQEELERILGETIRAWKPRQ